MTPTGFVKWPRALHQQVADLPREEFFAVLDLLVLANYEDAHTPDGLIIRRGQVLTSLAALADRWHLSSIKRVRTILQHLTGTGLVTFRGTGMGRGHGTLITLEFYGFSQGDTPVTGHVSGHISGPVSGQPKKKGGEEKKIQELSFVPFSHPSLQEVRDYDRLNDLHRDPLSFFTFHSPDWVDGNGQPIYDWKRYYLGWTAPPERASISSQLARLFSEDLA